MNNTEKALRTEILNQLKLVTKTNTPKVFEQLQTESGFSYIEQKIINMVAHEGITPSACIPHIEVEL